MRNISKVSLNIISLNPTKNLKPKKAQKLLFIEIFTPLLGCQPFNWVIYIFITSADCNIKSLVWAWGNFLLCDWTNLKYQTTITKQPKAVGQSIENWICTVNADTLSEAKRSGTMLNFCHTVIRIDTRSPRVSYPFKSKLWEVFWLKSVSSF